MFSTSYRLSQPPAQRPLQPLYNILDFNLPHSISQLSKKPETNFHHRATMRNARQSSSPPIFLPLNRRHAPTEGPSAGFNTPVKGHCWREYEARSASSQGFPSLWGLECTRWLVTSSGRLLGLSFPGSSISGRDRPAAGSTELGGWRFEAAMPKAKSPWRGPCSVTGALNVRC